MLYIRVPRSSLRGRSYTKRLLRQRHGLLRVVDSGIRHFCFDSLRLSTPSRFHIKCHTPPILFYFLRQKGRSINFNPAADVCTQTPPLVYLFIHFSHTSSFQLLDKPRSQVDVVPSSPRFLPSIFIAHRVQQSYCSSIFHRVYHTPNQCLPGTTKMYSR